MGSRLRYLVAFITGALVLYILSPIISMLLVIVLMALALTVITSYLIPGGRHLGYFVTRSLKGLLFYGRAGRTLLLAMVFSLLVLGGRFVGIPAELSAPLLGGLLGILVALSHSGWFEKGGSQIKVEEGKRAEKIFVELGKKGIFSAEGLTRSELESGVLIVGVRAGTVARKLILGLIGKGLKVIVIGSRGLVPAGVDAELFQTSAIDVSKDFESFEESPDNMVYALALAHRLKNDDVSNLIPAARLAREALLEGKISSDGLLLSIKINDRRLAPLFSNIAASTRSVATNGLYISRILSSKASIVCIEPTGPQRDQVFMVAYLLLMLADKNIVLVVENPEMVIKDINLLSYESREPWERVYLALDYAKRSGLVLVSRASPRAWRVWNLCQTYIFTELASPPIRVRERARQLLERPLKPMEAVISGEGDRRFKIEAVTVAEVEARKIEAKPSAKQGAVVIEDLPEAKAEIKPTWLEELFGERVVDYANIMEKYKGRPHSKKRFGKDVEGAKDVGQ